jgi:hypothetical protein
LQFLSDEDSISENKDEPFVIGGTGGKTNVELIKSKPKVPEKKNTRVNEKAVKAKRLEALNISEAEQKAQTLKHKRRATVVTRSKATTK